jgi:hypothetical protein
MNALRHAVPGSWRHADDSSWHECGDSTSCSNADRSREPAPFDSWHDAAVRSEIYSTDRKGERIDRAHAALTHETTSEE